MSHCIRILALGQALGLLACGSGALAQETTTYSYDALGRLIVSNTSRGGNAPTVTTIDYDAAGNRTTYAVKGAPQGGGGTGGGGATVPPPTPPPPPPTNPTPAQPRLVVVPLNGFTVIPLPAQGG